MREALFGTYLSHGKTLEQQLNLRGVNELHLLEEVDRHVPEPALTLGIMLAATSSGKLLSCNNTENFLGLNDD
jgi:hypothetical protein